MSESSTRDLSSDPWIGHFYDGKSAHRHPVTVSFGEVGLTITKENGETFLWPYVDITQAQGEHPGEPVRLEYGAPLCEAIVIEDRAFLSALWARTRGHHRQFRVPLPPARRVGQIAGALIVAIAGVLAAIFWGIPTMADFVTPMVPPAWEVALGQSALDQMVPKDQRCTNPTLQKQTQLILARLVDPSRAAYRLNLTIVDSKIFNAYALPGGEIVVFRSLLEETKTPDELAGVLAHEAQHVLLRHTTRSLLRDLSLAALIGAVFGDVTGISALTIQSVRTLSTFHYSRTMEEEADREGVTLLRQARMSPLGMLRFFEALKEREETLSVPLYLSTHPQTDERIADLKAIVGSIQDSQPIMVDEDWKKITALCH